MHKKAEKMYYVSLHLILMNGGKNSMMDYRESGGPEKCLHVLFGSVYLG